MTPPTSQDRPMFRKALLVCAALAVSASVGISSANAGLTLAELTEADLALAQATTSTPSKIEVKSAKSATATPSAPAIRKATPRTVVSLNYTRHYPLILGVTY
jgi:hypothetical protein